MSAHGAAAPAAPPKAPENTAVSRRPARPSRPRWYQKWTRFPAVDRERGRKLVRAIILADARGDATLAAAVETVVLLGTPIRAAARESGLDRRRLQRACRRVRPLLAASLRAAVGPEEET